MEVKIFRLSEEERDKLSQCYHTGKYTNPANISHEPQKPILESEEEKPMVKFEGSLFTPEIQGEVDAVLQEWWEGRSAVYQSLRDHGELEEDIESMMKRDFWGLLMKVFGNKWATDYRSLISKK
jgi:hypothetical protein